MCCVCFAVVKPGMKYRECGDVIQRHAQANGFSVVRTYCGHGIHRLVELLVTLFLRSQLIWDLDEGPKLLDLFESAFQGLETIIVFGFLFSA